MLTPKAKILHAKTEAELASHQVVQVGNTCSFHAISTGLKMLLNFSLDPNSLSDEVNRLWWRGRFMRVFPNWAVTPRMQVRIVRYLSRLHKLPISASFHHGDPENLPNILADQFTIPIVTILWPWRKAPQIFLGGTNHNFNSTRSAGGHSMIFAAYNPNQTTDGHFITPWGFINPWIDNARHLFWMTDEDFRRAWRFWLPGIGHNPLVLIRREDLSPESLPTNSSD